MKQETEKKIRKRSKRNRIIKQEAGERKIGKRNKKSRKESKENSTKKSGDSGSGGGSIESFSDAGS